MKFSESLHYLVDTLCQTPDLNAAKAAQILEASNIVLDDLQEWLHLDHAAHESYGRKKIFENDDFQILLLSWLPHDYSAIHDHGSVQWGAVKAFGNIETATYILHGNELTTYNRYLIPKGQIDYVEYDLIHQMGNPSEKQSAISLHIYGKNRAGCVRIFELDEQKIKKVLCGGAFFGLKENQLDDLPEKVVPNYTTWLRYMTELIRRVRKAPDFFEKDIEKLIGEFFDKNQKEALLNDIARNTDKKGYFTDSVAWHLLNNELAQAAKLQKQLLNCSPKSDALLFAQLYDQVRSQYSLNEFMKAYLDFFKENYAVKLDTKKLISIGCGTGLVEKYMLDKLGFRYENLYGIDISEAMVQVASQRINAEEGNVLTLDPAIQTWDLVYSGLNVLQYLDHTFLASVIVQIARILNIGGYFIGDFITPDHIRASQNVIFSEDKNIVSLRTANLIEKNHGIYLKTDITNVHFSEKGIRILPDSDERYLPPLSRVRDYFKRAFAVVDVYDAISLEPIPEYADTCQSTRYVIIAKR